MAPKRERDEEDDLSLAELPASPSTSADKKTVKSKMQRNDEGDLFVELGKSKRCTVRQFKGTTLVDVREYYDAGEGQMKPGKKGISLTLDQWRALLDNMDLVEGAVSAMEAASDKRKTTPKKKKSAPQKDDGFVVGDDVED